MVEYKTVWVNGARIVGPTGEAKVGETVKVEIKSTVPYPISVHIEAIWSRPGVPSATLLLNKTYTLKPYERREHTIPCNREGNLMVKIWISPYTYTKPKRWYGKRSVVFEVKIVKEEKREEVKPDIGKYIIMGGIALTGIAAVLSALRGG